MITLLTILLKYNGRALPDWPFHITLSSVIALCASVSRQHYWSRLLNKPTKVELVAKDASSTRNGGYDNASRGPLGSARLLFSPRARYLDHLIKG